MDLTAYRERFNEIKKLLSVLPDEELEERRWIKDYKPHPEAGISRGTTHRRVRELYINGKPFLGKGSWEELLESFGRAVPKSEPESFDSLMGRVNAVANRIAPSHGMSKKRAAEARALHKILSAGEINFHDFQAHVLNKGYGILPADIAAELGWGMARVYSCVSRAQDRLDYARLKRE